jgi:cell division protein FtsL
MSNFILGFLTCLLLSLVIFGVQDVAHHRQIDTQCEKLVQENYKQRKEIRGLWRELIYERGKRR